jgi:sirohydrochlorin ferrochelatase
LPEEVGQLALKYPNLKILFAGVFGSSPRIVDILIEQIQQVISKDAS